MKLTALNNCLFCLEPRGRRERGVQHHFGSICTAHKQLTNNKQQNIVRKYFKSAHRQLNNAHKQLNTHTLQIMAWKPFKNAHKQLNNAHKQLNTHNQQNMAHTNFNIALEQLNNAHKQLNSKTWLTKNFMAPTKSYSKHCFTPFKHSSQTAQ